MKVFIAHIHEEAELAEQVRDAIVAAFPNISKEVYVSSDRVHLGRDWLEGWRTAIRQAKVVLLLCSPSAVQRPWVSFEWGAGWMGALHDERMVLPLCHSGQQKDKLPFFWFQALQADTPSFSVNLFTTLGEALGIKPEPTDVEDFARNFLSSALRLKRLAVLPKPKEVRTTYLEATLTKKDDVLLVDAGDTVRSVTQRMAHEEWAKEVHRLQTFLSDPGQKHIAGVGLAVGIQNALWGDDKLYPGLRLKGELDKNKSGATVALGAFNTGYELLKSAGMKRVLLSASDLQDLFVVRSRQYRKQAISPASPVHQGFLRQFGRKAFRLRMGDGNEEIATVCVNKSLYVPRFEIGVWRYIDIGNAHNEGSGLIVGFGSDNYASEGSYWIWVDEDQAEFRSYGNTTQVPPPEGWPIPESAQNILATRAWLTENLGITDVFCPWGSDEDMKLDNVIKQPFSAPARALFD